MKNVPRLFSTNGSSMEDQHSGRKRQEMKISHEEAVVLEKEMADKIKYQSPDLPGGNPSAQANP